MGLGGPGGPELTVAEAIKALAPTSVIMVGIAFGMDAKKQKSVTYFCPPMLLTMSLSE